MTTNNDTVTLDIDDNLGKLQYRGRMFEVVVIRAEYWYQDFWEYRMIGYDAKGLIYAWPQIYNDGQHTLTMWGTPDAPIDECWVTIPSADVHSDDHADIDFTITGTFTVPANKKKPCATWDNGVTYLHADCTGRVGDFELLVYGQEDFGNRHDDRIEMVVFLTDGHVSCFGDLWLAWKDPEYWPEPIVHCFDGKKQTDDGKSLQDTFVAQFKYANVTFPDWFYLARNLTVPAPTHG